MVVLTKVDILSKDISRRPELSNFTIPFFPQDFFIGPGYQPNKQMREKTGVPFRGKGHWSNLTLKKKKQKTKTNEFEHGIRDIASLEQSSTREKVCRTAMSPTNDWETTSQGQRG